MALRFLREARLLSAADFEACFAQRQRLNGRFLLVHWQPASGVARLGLTISKKADKRAVVRNRIKRVVREQFRLAGPNLPRMNLVVLAKREAAAAPTAALAADFCQLLQRLAALPLPPVQGTMRGVSADAPPAAAVTSSGQS